MSRLKSVYFMDWEWSLDEAIEWMVAHKVRWTKVRHEGRQWRFVVRRKEDFARFRVKVVMSGFGGSSRRVYLVIGFYN